MPYTKLANTILTSTLWMEDDHTRLVWLTLLAMKDANGEVLASIPGLANIARVPIESCRAAIRKFMEPDLDSRTKDNEGRRIEEIDGGWFILNHEKYREMDSKDDQKAKAAARQRRFREKHGSRYAPIDSVTVTPPSVTHGDKSRFRPYTDTDTDTDTESETETQTNANAARSSAPTSAVRSRSRKPTDTIRWAISGWEGITPFDRASWATAYPACNIDRQLAAMDQWLRANPAKARKSRWRAFVTGWLSRSQDKGGDMASSRAPASGGDFHDFKRQAEDARKAKFEDQLSRVLAKLPD